MHGILLPEAGPMGRRAGKFTRGEVNEAVYMYLRLNVFYCFIVLCACISYIRSIAASTFFYIMRLFEKNIG